MSDCCSGGTCTSPKKHACPVDQHLCTEVDIRTVRHHVAGLWTRRLTQQRYFFCDSPDCDVVYFGENGDTFTTNDMRHDVGQKYTGPDKILCYCFGITLANYKTCPSVKDYVVELTKTGQCACEVCNPSGRCCLKDFPKI